MQTLEEIKQKVRKKRKQKVSVANPADQEVLLAIKYALEQDFCTFLLVGDSEKIRSAANDIALELDPHYITIEDVKDENAIARVAVSAVQNRKADILMKGNITTKSLLRAVLHKEYGLRSGQVLSHVALFEIPGQERLLFLTDAAMNIDPNLKEKTQIIQNAVKVAKGIGYQCPRVAILAPVEVVNEEMQSTIDAAILTQMQVRGQITGCTVDGPLAFDNAVSPVAAKHKNIQSDVAGKADILLVPSIEVGNALYKSFVYFAKAKVAAVVSGAKAPIVLTSRSDSAESKLNSLALALLSSTTFEEEN
ncbi:phosphate butyryltransferase [Virgibacillus sp. SK37]|uniref:phosphate butyryltransferase n=1 Tax=Virgibacillus sp. SK37 TaxID=403957 RepID=UPI0004D13BAF|nr:phosphate butyryltransferase [Virgibacillus sp. SK37]AIF43486.1 phosphate butyryltransferase [Virgibacillus sp. SK37]